MLNIGIALLPPFLYTFQKKVWKDLAYHDVARRYKIASFWSPYPHDVQQNLRVHVIDDPQVAKNFNPSGDLGVIKIDFILVGFGLWSMKPEDFWNRDQNWRRFHEFEQGLKGIVDVGTLVPSILYLDLEYVLALEGDEFESNDQVLYKIEKAVVLQRA